MTTSLRLTLPALVSVFLLGCPELGQQERTIVGEIPETPTWSEHVKPIMDVYCNECHSVPAEQLAPPSIRLDTCEDVGGVFGAKNQASRIVFRTIDQVPSPMPPLTYGIYPTNDEQEILQRWVDQGAQCDGGPPVNATTTDMGTPNGVPGDMGTPNNMTPDMGTPGQDAGDDMGVDMAPDVGEPATTWVMVAAQLNMKCSGANCHSAGARAPTLVGTPAEIQAAIEGQSATTGDMNLYITPSDPAASEIFLRVDSPNADFRMPRNAPQVDQVLADALESWINAGAPFE